MHCREHHHQLMDQARKPKMALRMMSSSQTASASMVEHSTAATRAPPTCMTPFLSSFMAAVVAGVKYQRPGVGTCREAAAGRRVGTWTWLT